MTEGIVIAAIVAGLFGAIVGPTLDRWLHRKKNRIEEVGTVADQWRDWAAELKARLEAVEQDVEVLKKALAAEESTNRKLRAKVEEQSRLLRSVVRWAITLRDELLKVSGAVPPTPIDVESALTSLDTDQP